MLKKSLNGMSRLDPQPAAAFVKAANKFNAEISLEKDGHRVNGKSIMGLMELANRHSEILTLIVDGADASQAIEVLSELLDKELNKC